MTRPLATIADLDALGEDAHAELIDGVIYERPVTTFDHANIAALIVADLLPPYQRGRGGPGGWWIQGENDFVAPSAEVFRPDALGWRKARMADPPRAGRVPLVPDWVLEVISESNRDHDEIVNRAAYARVGVNYWWLVDSAARSLTAHVLDGGVLREIARFEGAAIARAAPFEEVGARDGGAAGSPKGTRGGRHERSTCEEAEVLSAQPGDGPTTNSAAKNVRDERQRSWGLSWRPCGVVLRSPGRFA